MNTDAEQVIRQRAFEDPLGLLDASWPGEVPSTELATFFAQSSVHIEEAFQVACVWRQIMALTADRLTRCDLGARIFSCEGQSGSVGSVTSGLAATGTGG